MLWCSLDGKKFDEGGEGEEEIGTYVLVLVLDMELELNPEWNGTE